MKNYSIYIHIHILVNWKIISSDSDVSPWNGFAWDCIHLTFEKCWVEKNVIFTSTSLQVLQGVLKAAGYTTSLHSCMIRKEVECRVHVCVWVCWYASCNNGFCRTWSVCLRRNAANDTAGKHATQTNPRCINHNRKPTLIIVACEET